MIRRRDIAAAVLVAFAVPTGLLADLGKARAEKNLDRRTRLAMENTTVQLRLASQADKAGDWTKAKAALTEIRESVDLAYASQKETGRNPRSARQYKDLEVRLRRLLKSLEDFVRTLAFDQREEMAPLVEHIHSVHDEVLESVMTPKKQ